MRFHVHVLILAILQLIVAIVCFAVEGALQLGFQTGYAIASLILLDGVLGLIFELADLKCGGARAVLQIIASSIGLFLSLGLIGGGLIFLFLQSPASKFFLAFGGVELVIQSIELGFSANTMCKRNHTSQQSSKELYVVSKSAAATTVLSEQPGTTNQPVVLRPVAAGES